MDKKLHAYVNECRRRVAERRIAREATLERRALEVERRFWDMVSSAQQVLPAELRSVVHLIAPEEPVSNPTELLFVVMISGAPLLQVRMRHLVRHIVDDPEWAIRQVSVSSAVGVEQMDGGWAVALEDGPGLLSDARVSAEDALAAVERGVVLAAERAGDWHRFEALAFEKAEAGLAPVSDLDDAWVVELICDEVAASPILNEAALLRVAFMAMVGIYGRQAAERMVTFDLADVCALAAEEGV